MVAQLTLFFVHVSEEAVMFQVYMSQIKCDQQIHANGDFPYVLVTSVDLASSPTNPQFEVFRLGPFEDASAFKTGGTYPGPFEREDPGDRTTRTFWGVNSGMPAPLISPTGKLDDPKQAIFVVSVMVLNDNDNPIPLRTIVKERVGSSLAGSVSLSRPEKVAKLIRDVDGALETPSSSAPNKDDKIGPPQRLPLSRQELIQAEFGSPVSKSLVFEGPGGQYTLTFNVAGIVRLRSENVPNHFIRHRNSLGELTSLTTAEDMQDSLFELSRGLAEQGPDIVSLQAMRIPNRYLRHQDFRLKLQPLLNDGPDVDLFRKDATFHVDFGGIRPLEGALRPGFRGVSFRSLNFPDRFIRHRDFHLFVEGDTGGDFFRDCAFHIPVREL
jgi:hypothetical protein